VHEDRQGSDPRQHRKLLEVTRIATSPRRAQERAAMLNARGCSQSRFDTFADNKTGSDHLIRRQPNDTSFGGSQSLPTVNFFASGANRPTMDRPRLACYRIGPQRDKAAASRTTLAPGAARMPSKCLANAFRQCLERDAAAGQITRCWRS